MRSVYPINKIEREKNLKLKNKKFVSYKQSIKDKYQLDDLFFIKMNNLSFEELLAIKFEDALNTFNGSLFIPLVEYYEKLVFESYKNLLNFYVKNDSTFKRKVLYTLFYNKHKSFTDKRAKNENIKTK